MVASALLIFWTLCSCDPLSRSLSHNVMQLVHLLPRAVRQCSPLPLHSSPSSQSQGASRSARKRSKTAITRVLNSLAKGIWYTMTSLPGVNDSPLAWLSSSQRSRRKWSLMVHWQWLSHGQGVTLVGNASSAWNHLSNMSLCSCVFCCFVLSVYIWYFLHIMQSCWFFSHSTGGNVITTSHTSTTLTVTGSSFVTQACAAWHQVFNAWKAWQSLPLTATRRPRLTC